MAILRHFFALFLLFLAFFANHSSYAQTVLDADFTVPLLKGSPLALGGAYRALANDNQALLWNPAGIMQNKQLSGSGEWMTGDFQNNDVYAGTAVDSRSDESYGIGFAYDYISEEVVGNSVEYQQYTLGIAYLLKPGLMMGFSGKYYVSSVASPAVEGPDGYTMDLGALWYVTRAISVATVLQNFIEGVSNPNVPMTLSAGVAIRPDQHGAIMFDIVQDLSTNADASTNFHVGGQYAFSDDFTLRSGFGWDRVRDNPFLGAGLLVTAPRAWLGFTYSRRFDPTSNNYSVYLEMRI